MENFLRAVKKPDIFTDKKLGRLFSKVSTLYLGKFKKKIAKSDGFTLIEVVLIIAILAIAIPSLVDLLSTTLIKSNKLAILSQAISYAQEKMEQIIADKKSLAKGYNWVIAPGRYQPDSPASGFSRSVTITSGNLHNGVIYAFVEVVVSHNDIPEVKLTTWLTEY